MNNYEQQATDFCNKYGVQLDIEYKEYGKHFEEDKEPRDIYSVFIKRGSRGYSLEFGQSLNESGVKVINRNTGRVNRVFDRKDVTNKKGQIDPYLIGLLLKYPLASCDQVIKPTPPTVYNILACLTKNDPETFEDFCSNFGYDADSKRAERVYNAVKDEWKGMQVLFNDEELTELQEIN